MTITTQKTHDRLPIVLHKNALAILYFCRKHMFLSGTMDQKERIDTLTVPYKVIREAALTFSYTELGGQAETCYLSPSLTIEWNSPTLALFLQAHHQKASIGAHNLNPSTSSSAKSSSRVA